MKAVVGVAASFVLSNCDCSCVKCHRNTSATGDGSMPHL